MRLQKLFALLHLLFKSLTPCRLHDKCLSICLFHSYLSSSLQAKRAVPFIFFLSLYPCVRSKIVPYSSHTFPLSAQCVCLSCRKTETEQEERWTEVDWECLTANHWKISYIKVLITHHRHKGPQMIK